jgi:hypothetical protein
MARELLLSQGNEDKFTVGNYVYLRNMSHKTDRQ